MATVEEQRSTEIPVDNPATGEVIRSVPAVVGRGAARDGRARPRGAARVGGARLRRPRHASCAARRSGSPTTRSGSRRRSSSESGKTYEDALLAEVAYARQRVRLLGQARPRLPRRREGPLGQPVRARPQARRALPPARAGRRDRAVELPADELLRRLHPGDGGRQRGDPQARRGDAADLAADGRGHEGGRPARGHLPGRPGQGLGDRAGADRPRRHDHVHRLDRDRQVDHGARRAARSPRSRSSSAARTR